MNTIYELAEKIHGLLVPFGAEVQELVNLEQGDRVSDWGLSRHGDYRAIVTKLPRSYDLSVHCL